MSAYKYFNKNYSLESISEVFHSKIMYKSSAGIDGVNQKSFEKRKKVYFQDISRKVKNNTYRFTPYKEQLKLKGRNKYPRVISIPTIRDKITLKILSMTIKDAFSRDIKGYLIQNIVNDIKVNLNSGNYDHFIKIDIQNFYPTIDHEILTKKIKNRIRKEEIVNLIRKSIKTPTISGSNNSKRNKPMVSSKGIPQGLSISNILADIYLNSLDILFRNKDNIKYFRYVDDILILCKKADLPILEKGIISSIKGLKLEVNNDKNKKGSIGEGFSFLGYEYSPQKAFTVRGKSLKKLEDSLILHVGKCKDSINLNEFNREIWDLNLKITGCIIDDKKYGWVFYFSQIDDLKMLYHLDWLIREIICRKELKRITKENIKRFVRVHHEIIFNLSNTSYIPNFDTYSLERKRQILKEVFSIPDIKLLTDEEIDIVFKKNIYKVVKQLEKDVQGFS